MTRPRKITTPKKAAPKIHWVDDVKEPFGGYTLNKEQYKRHPLYKYLPEVSAQKNLEQMDLKKRMEKLNVLRDEKGEPLVLYHCTPAEFEHFLPLSFFGTLEQAKNVGFESVFLDNRAFKKSGVPYEEVSEKKLENKTAWRQLQRMQELQIIPVCLSIKKPLCIPDLGSHEPLTYEMMVMNLLERESYTEAMLVQNPLLKQFAIAGILLNYWLEKKPPVVEMIFKDPRHLKPQEIAHELELGKMFDVRTPYKTLYTSAEIMKDEVARCDNLNCSINNIKNTENLIMQRMIRFLERKGYDGLVFKNHIDDDGTQTYVPFRAEQVIRLDRRIGARVSTKKLSPIQERRLALLETAALHRCKERVIDKIDKKFLINLQERRARDIPDEILNQDAALKERVKRWVEDLKNTSYYDD